jgi:hypothetical protein
MTPEERLMQLAASARREVPPAVDVTARVTAMLDGLPAQAAVISTRPLAWLAAASSIAAAIAVVAAIQFSGTEDSITEITNSIAWVIR